MKFKKIIKTLLDVIDKKLLEVRKILIPNGLLHYIAA